MENFIPIYRINLLRHYLRQNIGVVEQEPFLFSASIKENLCYGIDENNATMERIIQAAKTTAIHEDIEKFKDSYNTIIGEKGVTLSGGQKQRIAIARTLLKDPGILIIDDSTSSVNKFETCFNYFYFFSANDFVKFEF
jgi:ATP-binding cassette subfamily B protein